MCKNAKTPCRGCKRQERADAAFLFFTDEERISIEASRRPPAPFAPSLLKPEPGQASHRPAAFSPRA